MVPGLQITANPQGEGNIPSLNEDILHVCTSYSLQNVCPEISPGADRAFKIPVDMRTIEQLRGWGSMLIEIQMQRVSACEGGEGHACRWPTVRFGGSPGEAWKAIGWLLDWYCPCAPPA